MKPGSRKFPCEWHTEEGRKRRRLRAHAKYCTMELKCLFPACQEVIGCLSSTCNRPGRYCHIHQPQAYGLSASPEDDPVFYCKVGFCVPKNLASRPRSGCTSCLEEVYSGSRGVPSDLRG